MQSKYKSYWRKSGLKGKWGNIFLERISLHNPKNVLEIGVFCGVTARNICDLLNKENGNNFNYIGVDLFGGDQSKGKDEIKPTFLKDQRFSNPLKNIYYNYILKENLNSIKSVSKLLKKYTDNIKLIAGDTNKVLKELDLQNIDFTFLDGGHSYQTVINDLTILYEIMKDKKKVILCERGIRSYDKYTRNLLDLSAVPSIKTLSHLPIIVDPSHGTGRKELISPMAKGSLAVGAHGIMVEVHDKPREALSDGYQALLPEEFAKLSSDVFKMSQTLN